jgi:hypothetical protein
MCNIYPKADWAASLRNVECELIFCSHRTAIFVLESKTLRTFPFEKIAYPVNIDTLAFLPYISAPLCLFGNSRDASNRYLTLRPLFLNSCGRSPPFSIPNRVRGGTISIICHAHFSCSRTVVDLPSHVSVWTQPSPDANESAVFRGFRVCLVRNLPPFTSLCALIPNNATR